MIQRALLMLTLLVAGQAVHAQTLARKNWAGSGMSAQVWWGRAVFCRAPDGPWKATVKLLDRMQARGCDAVVVSAPGETPDPDADALIEGAVHRTMRVVLEITVTPSSEAVATARMRLWLNRGVAGFVVTGTADPAMIKRLRAVTAGALGTRVLIGDGIGAPPEVQLALRRVGAGGSVGIGPLRAALAGAPGGVLLAGGTGAQRVRAAMLLANGAAAEIPIDASKLEEPSGKEFSADELMLWVPRGDPSLRAAEDAAESLVTAWVAALTELHRANLALATGTATYLNHDGQGVLAWVVRGKPGAAPVLAVCNLSGHPLRVSVRDEVKALGVKGGYLRTLLLSDPQRPGQPVATLDAIDLAVDGVFLGEIR